MTNEEKEQLAIAQGLYKAIGAMVSMKDPDSLRGRVDGEIMRDAANGKKSTIVLTIAGEEVGQVVPRFSKKTTGLLIDSWPEFRDWLLEAGNIDVLHGYMYAHRDDLAKWCAERVLETDGEVPAGCTPYTEPAMIIGTTIKGCEPEKVAYAMGMTLPQAVVHLLGGEVE